MTVTVTVTVTVIVTVTVTETETVTVTLKHNEIKGPKVCAQTKKNVKVVNFLTSTIDSNKMNDPSTMVTNLGGCLCCLVK